ncbi:MAG: hypothetical protein RLZZ11_1778, partial [Cyanobacteriota bacterium]
RRGAAAGPVAGNRAELAEADKEALRRG